MPENVRLKEVTEDVAQRVNNNIINQGSATSARSVRINVRISESEYALLKRFAEESGRKVSDAARYLIFDTLKDRFPTG